MDKSISFDIRCSCAVYVFGPMYSFSFDGKRPIRGPVLIIEHFIANLNRIIYTLFLTASDTVTTTASATL